MLPVIPRTVGVACPRCNTQVQCTLDEIPSKPKPGAKPSGPHALTVPDLAERLADHYAAAHPNALQQAMAAGRELTTQLAEEMANA